MTGRREIKKTARFAHRKVIAATPSVMPHFLPPGQQTVMVVDDSGTTRKIIAKELEEAGFAVRTCSDGLEAMVSLKSMNTPPDLITLDIDMPRMNGFVCCEKIRELEAQGVWGNRADRIPVLFVSANDSFEHRSRGFHLGSLEFIALPFVQGNIAKAVTKVLRPQTTFAGMTALVVDDNPTVRKMVASCLRRIGLGTVEAENGRQAYDHISENPDRFDLVIVDFDMPVMRGDEFIHHVRQFPKAKHLPLITLSGSGETNAVLHMFRAGASDYLIKPFIAEELLARVQVHLHLRRYVRRLEEVNRNLYEKAVNDKLTGLRNKQYFQAAFDEMFARAMRAGTDMSCLFFDLDHFKRVNDTCGHGFGDYVLQTVGGLVKNAIRGGDLAARFGGEEFVIVLPNTSLDKAMFVAEKLRALIAGHPFNQQGQYWPLTISIGVASLCNNQPRSALDFLNLADQALYLAKNSGRNRVYFLP